MEEYECQVTKVMASHDAGSMNGQRMTAVFKCMVTASENIPVVTAQIPFMAAAVTMTSKAKAEKIF
jgi:hypothetical protein